MVVGALTAALAGLGSIKLTWSFSAFTVLIYYAITNLAALAMPTEARRYSRWYSLAGLAACLVLVFWIEWQIAVSGLVLIFVGLTWHAAAQRLVGRTADPIAD